MLCQIIPSQEERERERERDAELKQNSENKMFAALIIQNVKLCPCI